MRALPVTRDISLAVEAPRGVADAASRLAMWTLLVAACVFLLAAPSAAQGTRTAAVEARQADKARRLTPDTLPASERVIRRLQRIFTPAPPGIAPTIGGVRPGSGFAPGVAVLIPAGRGRLTARAAWSLEQTRRIGMYTDPGAARYLADVLLARRRRILEAYLPAVNPLVDPSLGPDGMLRFSNAAVDLDVARRPASYAVTWHVYDVRTDTNRLIGATTSAEPAALAPIGLPTTGGTFVRAAIGAYGGVPDSWSIRVQVFFRRQGDSWKLVGLDRLEEG